MTPAKLMILFGRPILGGATTYNPADKGTSVTLTNGNRTMSKSGAGQQMVRSTTSHATTGKYYSEQTCVSTTGNCVVGQAGSGASLSNYLGFDFDGLGYRPDGAVLFNSTTIATYSTYTTGDVIGLAHDFGAGKLWFSKNGVWQSGSPATGAGGLSIVNTIFLATSASGGDTVTLNSGQDPFALDIPPGYAPWG